MRPRLDLVTLVASLCLACGVAERVDDVAGPSREPQAVLRTRACPELGSWLMVPKTPSVGAPADVRVNVSDADTPLEQLSFDWVAESGTFSEPHATHTTFTCEREGYQTIALVTRDDTDCVRALDIQLVCFPP